MRIPLRVHCQQPLPGNAAWVITERTGHLVVYLAPDVPEDSPIEQQFVRQALRAWRGRRGRLLALLPLGGGAWAKRPKAKHAAVGGAAAAAVIAAGVAFAAMQLGPETPAKRPPAVSAPQVDPTTRPPDGTPPSKPPTSDPPADGAPVADPSRPAASSPARTLRPRHHRPTHGHSHKPTRPADPPKTPAGPPVVGTPPSQPEPSRSCHLVQVHLDLGLATVQVCL